MTDNRESERIEFGVNVDYILADGTTVQIGKIFNSNDGGCSIKTSQEIAPNTNIKFRIEDSAYYSATVIWCQKTPVQVGTSVSYDVGIEYHNAIKGYVNGILKKIHSTINNIEITR